MSHKTWTDICTNGFSKPYHYTSRETTHQKGTIDDPAAHHCPKHRNSNLNSHRDYLKTKQFPHHTAQNTMRDVGRTIPFVTDQKSSTTRRRRCKRTNRCMSPPNQTLSKVKHKDLANSSGSLLCGRPCNRIRFIQPTLSFGAAPIRHKNNPLGCVDGPKSFSFGSKNYISHSGICSLLSSIRPKNDRRRKQNKHQTQIL